MGQRNVPAVSSALVDLETELDRLRTVTEQLERCDENSKSVVAAAKRVTTAAGDFVKPAESMIQEIQAVDFPKRFVEVDRQLSEVKKAITKQVEETTQGIQQLGAGSQERHDSLSECLQVIEAKEAINCSLLKALGSQVEKLAKTVVEIHGATRGVLEEQLKTAGIADREWWENALGEQARAHQAEIDSMKKVLFVVLGVSILGLIGQLMIGKLMIG